MTVLQCSTCGKIIHLTLQQTDAIINVRNALTRLRALDLKTDIFNTLSLIDNTAHCCKKPNYFYYREKFNIR